MVAALGQRRRRSQTAATTPPSRPMILSRLCPAKLARSARAKAVLYRDFPREYSGEVKKDRLHSQASAQC